MLVEMFTSPVCAPCKAMKPIVELARSEGHNIVEVDIYEDFDYASSKGVASTPTFIAYKDDVETKRHVGAMRRQDFINFLS